MLMSYMLKHSMNDFYLPGLKRLFDVVRLLGFYIQIQFPKLYKHFGSHNFDPILYATPYFLTLFVYNMPVYQVVRVWDMFFLMGECRMDFVYEFILAYLQLEQRKLLDLDLTHAAQHLHTLFIPSESDLVRLFERALDLDMVKLNQTATKLIESSPPPTYPVRRPTSASKRRKKELECTEKFAGDRHEKPAAAPANPPVAAASSEKHEATTAKDPEGPTVPRAKKKKIKNPSKPDGKKKKGAEEISSQQSRQ